MRLIRASLLSFSLLWMACGGGENTQQDRGEIAIKMSSYLELDSAFVKIYRGGTELEMVTLQYDPLDGTWIGTSTPLEVGIYSIELLVEIGGTWPTMPRVDAVVQAGQVTSVLLYVPEDAFEDRVSPKITSVTMDKTTLEPGESLQMNVAVSGTGPFTLEGLADPAAGSFGAAQTGPGPFTMTFTAGTLDGTYSLTLRVTDDFDSSDEVTFEVVIAGETVAPGTLAFVVGDQFAPTIDYSTVTRNTAAGTTFELVFTATAAGGASGQALGWAADMKTTGCRTQTSWTVNGQGVSGNSTTGTVADEGTVSLVLSLSRPTLPSCSPRLRVTDALGARQEYTWAINTSRVTATTP